MRNCYFIGCFLILLLGSFCIWNCYQQEKPLNITSHGCRDQDGQLIDSFILYKLPYDPKSSNSLIQQGLGYMYLTPDTPDILKQSGGVSSVLSYSDTAAGWILSNRSIGHTKSMPGYTLDNLYSQVQYMKENAVYIFYNDEFPNGTTSESYGHTKGVVVMTEQGGFWLVHSTPRYPPSPLQQSSPHFVRQQQLHKDLSEKLHSNQDTVITFNSDPFSIEDNESLNFIRDGSERRQNDESSGKDYIKGGSYDYPATGTRYGQTFICLSLPPEQADNLGWQLQQNKPYIYAANVAERLRGRFPVLERVVAGRSPSPDSAQFRVTQLATQQGNTFTSFAKHTKFGKDLYSGLVAPNLKTDLLVESWRNGPNPLPSECNATQYKVKNIESLSVRVLGSSFTTHHDHSKWAVSNDSSKPYVCVGDINRMKTQFHRAGGTVCVWSQTIWNRFYRMVTTFEKCPARRP